MIYISDVLKFLMKM